MRNLLTLIALIALISCSFGKEKSEGFKLSNLKFKSIFGYSTSDSIQAYCLLGTGFLRARFSPNADSLIDAWINNHPNAITIPISTIDEPNHKLTYCWLVDNGDTINNYLIKNGCFPGGAMMHPESSTAKVKIKIHIDRKGYSTFIKQIQCAEIFAKKNKLGIWSTELITKNNRE